MMGGVFHEIVQVRCGDQMRLWFITIGQKNTTQLILHVEKGKSTSPALIIALLAPALFFGNETIGSTDHRPSGLTKVVKLRDTNRPCQPL